MPKLLLSVQAVPLDDAIIHTPCTACRARLHRLRMILETAEALAEIRPAGALSREETIGRVEVAVAKALRRLEAHVHVCVEALGKI